MVVLQDEDIQELRISSSSDSFPHKRFPSTFQLAEKVKENFGGHLIPLLAIKRSPS